ncbi:30S ribosomal protein S17 [Candidatus Microgenomates bacterium]|nr:30S ribosomal protein S17 [Candidatus Microgenomates bacterium]
MKIFSGKVISTKMAKTATTQVERIIAHPLYKKRMRKTRVFHVHDEESKAKVGDLIKFTAGRPVSKLKRWNLVSIESSGNKVSSNLEKEKSLPAKVKTAGKPKRKKN